jgi:hypothetical protein
MLATGVQNVFASQTVLIQAIGGDLNDTTAQLLAAGTAIVSSVQSLGTLANSLTAADIQALTNAITIAKLLVNSFQGVINALESSPGGILTAVRAEILNAVSAVRGFVTPLTTLAATVTASGATGTSVLLTNLRSAGTTLATTTNVLLSSVGIQV